MQITSNTFLVEDPIWCDYEGKRIYVRHGWVTDLASVPKIFQNIFSPYAFSDCGAMPALIHDALYLAEGAGVYSKKEVDRMFYDLLIHCKTPRWKAYLMYAAVRVGGRWGKDPFQVSKFRQKVEVTNAPATVSDLDLSYPDYES